MEIRGGRLVLQLTHLGKCLFVALAFVMSAEAHAMQAENPQLIQLRHQLALHYLEPAPHMALAKYYWEKGDRLQAFYLLEYARRGRFPETEFNQAFQASFGGDRLMDKGKRGEAFFTQGIDLQREGKLKEAEELFEKAAELAPNSAHIQTWVGRFFFKVKKDNGRALPYYLNAYFLDPHAYESEFVESRIQRINGEAAEMRYRQLTRSGVPLVKILDEPDPTVVHLALSQISEQWQAAYLKPVLDRMGHDDEGVRWLATEAIMKNVGRTFDATLQALLRDSDLRKRGLAAYLAVHLWKQGSFDALRGMLREEAQLLRFDALSALMLEGGDEGRQIVLEHRRHESNPTLKRLIDAPVERP
jgi:tetratricopeptide (TPR) repeat protein